MCIAFTTEKRVFFIAVTPTYRSYDYQGDGNHHFQSEESEGEDEGESEGEGEGEGDGRQIGERGWKR